MHRKLISVRPRKIRPDRNSLEQAAFTIYSGSFVDFVRYRQCQLHPFIVGKLAQEWKIVRLQFVVVLQKLEKLFRDLQEVGRLRLVQHHELPDKRVPLLLLVQFCQDRKSLAE